MFFKYRCSESSDLHEILCGGQLLSCELKFQISWRFVHKCMCTSCKGAQAHFIANTHVYNLCVGIYAQIFMKFKILAHEIVIDQHIKFYEDPSFCCGDICKTILVFFKCWFSMYFSYFPNIAPPKPSEMDNCWIILKFFGN